MPQSNGAKSTPRTPLSAALRALRRSKGLRAIEVAAAMGIALRTYGNLESGRTPATPERLRALAAVLGCDYAGLWLCAGGVASALAVVGADNKAVTIAIDALEDLHQALPTAFATLTGVDLVAAFGRAQRRLQAGAIEKSRLRFAQADEAAAPLTRRQLECLRWAQAGKSATDIGAILGISRRTVETHLAEACARLGVRTRVQAISRAIEVGLLSPRPP